MKKLDSKQHKESPEEELKRLRKRVKQLEGKEVKKSGKQHEQTKGKLKKAKDDLKQTKAELKKKDVTTITLTKEQSELLSTLFPDIDIHSL